MKTDNSMHDSAHDRAYDCREARWDVLGTHMHTTSAGVRITDPKDATHPQTSFIPTLARKQKLYWRDAVSPIHTKHPPTSMEAKYH